MALAIAPIELLAPTSTSHVVLADLNRTSCARQLYTACVPSPQTHASAQLAVQCALPSQTWTQAVPLSPQQLTDFVQDGCLVIWPTVPGGEAFHRGVCAEAAQAVARGNVGNNVIADEAATSGVLDPLFDSPELVGALTTLLGEDYTLMPHRHCHLAKTEGQQLHQDDYFGYDNFRQMVPTDLIAFYYPQAVTAQMGPTAVVPGSQYSRRSGPLGQWVPEGVQQKERLLTLDRPGGVMLMHWHLWHHASARTGSNLPERYAFKVQFRRRRPLRPVPAIARSLSTVTCPFLFQEEHSGDALAQSEGPGMTHRLTCSCVWSALVGTPLPPRIAAAAFDRCRGSSAGAYRYAALAAASGIWPASEALEEIASVVSGRARVGASRAGSPASSSCGASVRSGSVSPPGSPMTGSQTPAPMAVQPMIPGGLSPPTSPVPRSLSMPQPAMPLASHEVGGTEMLVEVAAAIQLLSPQLMSRELCETLGDALMHAVTESLGVVTSTSDTSSPSRAVPVDGWRMDWRLEAVQAVAGLLPPRMLLPSILPLIQPSQSNRVQLRALYGLLDSAVRWSAAENPEWRAACDSTQLEEQLLACVAHWQNFASIFVACMQQRPAADFLGRYILAEALRCIGFFGLPSTARRAAHLIGVGGHTELYNNPGWRKRFLLFIERRRRCPITTAGSPF
eukprot:TRINITY_DN73734_c0_g1_i1.p1 TRINITY_DN73734_c0_g1~~TRINITY_DN73734_c0_g1_i1.p1  ORF type:complete len:699 (-),score=100.65 TRINITY_DN73734_c0_g1_i1:131-2161(-)